MMPEERLKLVVSGPLGAGKTTFIQSLSEVPVVETDELASEDIGKVKTTVAMDFGLITLDGITLYLFGTPGQERFSFIWEVLMEGALGLVLLVAGDNPRLFPQARRILDFLTSQFPVPFVVGVTRQDLPRVWKPEEVAIYFRLPQDHVMGLNATKRDDCIRVLTRILELLRATPGET
jgi:hypothetical protein